jgi:pimeloyl-ACP methyl ester carboxylesterase
MASAAAVWAAAERPDRIDGIILIGPFVREMPTSWAMSALMKVAFVRPWGVPVWSRYYASLYPTSPPVDFASYQADLRENLSQPGRFAALQEMLGASKAPCEARIPQVKARVLVIMGSKDPDFSDPAAEANLVARRLHGDLLMVDGAGHYPHVEMPEKVEPSIIKFLGGVADGTKNRA